MNAALFLLLTSCVASGQDIAVVSVPHGHGATLEHRIAATCDGEVILFTWDTRSGLAVSRQNGQAQFAPDSRLFLDGFAGGRPTSYTVECHPDGVITLQMIVTRRGEDQPITQRSYAEFAPDGSLLDYTGFHQEPPERINRHLD